MDTLIAGAKLYDGFGGSGRCANVLLSGDRIAAVTPPGKKIPAAGIRVEDGRGLALAPGFIDAHSHSDENYFETPGADSKISQGVTTEICGNCGFSPDERGDHGGLAGFIRHLKETVPAVNVATFTGFNSLRMQVMDSIDRPATPAEIGQMKAIFAEELKLGSLGLSSGLYYVSGKFAPEAEVAALAALLKGTGKPYATHLRSEEAGLLDALREAISIARAGSGSLQVSHFKTMGTENFNKLDDAIRLLDEARADGLRVHADRYPYTYSSTGLRNLAPAPFDRLEDRALQEKLAASADACQKLAGLWRSNPPDWTKVLMVDSPAPEQAQWIGKTIAEIAEALAVQPEKAMTRLLARAMPRAAFGCMSEENLKRILTLDWVFAGSDAGCRAFGNARVHPRAFGTMPEFFRIARAAGVDPGRIIRRMTLDPAVKFQLDKRGAVKPGFHADLVLFDEENFASAADYIHADRPAQGIRCVWVNGVAAYRPDTGISSGRAGRFLAC